MYNFDKIIDRSNTNSVKYDKLKELFGSDNLIPMWVADMDFRTPNFIIDKLKQRLEHEVLGYTFRNENFYKSTVDWIAQQHGWNINPEWISFSPGVVPAFTMIINAFTHPGDKIIVQSPVYFPFFDSVLNSGRQLINNQLKFENNRYTMDFNQLMNQIDSKTKMILLCSPHNPVGRVWTKDELLKLANICIENNILIVADEIHSDIILTGAKHIPIASLSEDISNITITTYAPSKTFNIAGLSTSIVVAQNKTLKATYDNYIENLHIHFGNIFGNIALEAAYSEGAVWLQEMLRYIEHNFDLLRQFAAQHKDKLNLIEPEATYLAWIDFNKLNLSNDKLQHLIIKKAKLGLNNGIMFGAGGEGFQRMNLACPESTLTKALSQLEFAMSEL